MNCENYADPCVHEAKVRIKTVHLENSLSSYLTHTRVVLCSEYSNKMSLNRRRGRVSQTLAIPTLAVSNSI